MRPSPPSDSGAEFPWRWMIAALLFVGTLINYVDRQTISVLAPVLCHDLGLSNTQYGSLGSFFLLTYALSMWLWGGVFDRLGNRAGYTVAVVIWSVAEMAHALARGLGSLSLVRACLGLGEAGNWPGATRTVAAWFAARQRALGLGIANAGAAIGPAVAAPLIVWLQIRFGWRAVFLVTGVLGFVWLAAWLVVYPRQRTDGAEQPLGPHSYGGPPSPARSGLRRGGLPAGERAKALPWRDLVGRPEFWGIVLARFFGDPIWWLYLNWLPKYLFDVRHFSMKEIGASAWVPYVAAGFGALFGGWLSGHLIGRGWTVNRARKTAIGFATFLLPAGVAAAFVESPFLALACISVTLFAFQFWVSNVQTLPSDYFPVGAVGSIAGFAGTAAGFGAMIFTFSTGWVVDRFSYTPILVTAGLLAPIATGVLFLLAGKVRRLAI